MKLSSHFSLSEFTKSQEAIRKGINNIPSLEIVDNLRTLCDEVLEPIRQCFGPVTINSGYRSQRLNKAIGGSDHSQHCFGEAADFEVMKVSNKEVAKWIAAMLKFDQLILEFHDEGEPRSGWVHVSYRKGMNRQQVFRAVKKGKKTVYLQGL